MNLEGLPCMDPVQTGRDSSGGDVSDECADCCTLRWTRDHSDQPTYDFPFDVVCLVFDMSLVTIHDPALDGYKKIRFKFNF